MYGICLPNCLSIDQSVDPWAYGSLYLSICECPSVHWSIYPSIYPSIHLSSSIHVSIHPFLHFSVHPSIHLSIYLAFNQVLYLPISRTFQHSACSFARMLQRALTWLLLARFHGDAGIGQIRYHTKNESWWERWLLSSYVHLSSTLVIQSATYIRYT